MKKVIEILFDEKQGLPIFVLKDGSKRIPVGYPTGSCWVTYWVSEEEAEKLNKK